MSSLLKTEVHPLRELLSVALAAAAQGSKVLAGRGDSVLSLNTKSADGDLVTQFDLAAEKAVRHTILDRRPNDTVSGEELPTLLPGNPSGYRWSIDPLDGTTNFTRSMPHFATSVAVCGPGGNWLAGVVDAPRLGRVYSASLGQGAWLDCDGVRVRLAGPKHRSSGRLLGTGFSYLENIRKEQYARLPDLMELFVDLRRTGSAALDICAVADGALDAFLERDLKEYDWAAASLIAEEAGLTVTRPTSSAGDLLLVSDASIHRELMERSNRVND